MTTALEICGGCEHRVDFVRDSAGVATHVKCGACRCPHRIVALDGACPLRKFTGKRPPRGDENCSWVEALDRACRWWEGTPHVAGQMMPGRGVDCIQFVVAVLDRLYRAKPPRFPRFPLDVTLFDRREGIRIVHAFAERHRLRLLRGVSPELVEPGDVLVQRFEAAHHSATAVRLPGHLLIVGSNPGEAWHAGTNGVSRVAWMPRFKDALRLYRPPNKESWRL